MLMTLIAHEAILRIIFIGRWGLRVNEQRRIQFKFAAGSMPAGGAQLSAIDHPACARVGAGRVINPGRRR
jgi:hypothetical protein